MTDNSAYISEFFPNVEPAGEPLGPRVLVQLRMVKKKSKGGLILAKETRDFNKGVTTVGKVLKVGPLAFRNRETKEPWPEGIWVKEGDVVLVNEYLGHRFQRPVDDDTDVVFVILEDAQLQFKVDVTADNISKFFEEVV